MRALVVYCHPRPESFTAAVRDVVLVRLSGSDAGGDLDASTVTMVPINTETANGTEPSFFSCT